MPLQKNPSRRELLKTGLTGAAGAVAVNIVSSGKANAAIKKDGRPIILAFMGQHCHNPIFMELNLRAMLAKMDWRILFTQYSEFLTPENIAMADIVITLAGVNSYKGFSVGYVPEGLVEKRPEPAPFMTEEQGDAIIDGVKNRGMGFLCLHNTIWQPAPKLFEILGCEVAMHPPIEAVWYKNMNQSHPITKGLEPWVEDDEQFFAKITNPNHTILYSSEGTVDHRETTAGWCFDYGKGRIVTMLPGHTEFIWQHPTWQQLMLRSCMWMLRKEIPENTLDLVASKHAGVRTVGGFESKR